MRHLLKTKRVVLFIGFIAIAAFIGSNLPVMAASKPLTLKVHLQARQTKDERYQAFEKFANEVKSRTNGMIEMEGYFTGQLVKDKDTVSAVPQGIVQLAQANFGLWAGLVPELNALDLQMLFDSKEHYWRCQDGKLGEVLANALEKKANTKLISWMSQGPTDAFISTKKTLRRPEDFKGLKIRAPGQARAMALESLGASPTIIAASEAYLALQRGTIDGIISTSRGALLLKWFEVAPYLTRHEAMAPDAAMGLVMNLDAWNKLSKEQQQIFMDAGKKSILEWTRQVFTEKNEQYWAELKPKKGVEIYVVPGSEIQMWRSVIIPEQVDFLEKKLSGAADALLDCIEQSR